MYVATVSDGNALLALAVRTRQPVHVTTAHVVAPDRAGQRRPALLLQYSLTNPVDGITWSFKEVTFPTMGGQITMAGTLYERLRTTPGISIQESNRSGSL